MSATAPTATGPRGATTRAGDRADATPRATSLPPGPRMPIALQTLAMRTRQRPFLERARRRYGSMFSVQVVGLGKTVIVSDPELIKQTFRAEADVLHAGTGSPLRIMLGDHSLLGIDEDEHMQQRKLLLAPFKGQRMQKYESVVAEEAAREIDSWPQGIELATDEPMQRITLRVILRAVFGAEGQRLQDLEELVPTWTTMGSRLVLAPWMQRSLGGRSPWDRFLRLRRRIDAIFDELIAVAKDDPNLAERADVLAMLVQARHDDGTPMSNAEIADELVTLLAAGHETTAHTLAWAVERIRRHPEVLARLNEEVASGGKTYREATIREIQRSRPVIAFAGRVVRKPFSLGGYDLALHTRILMAGCLTHYDPALFQHPDRFDPDRFVGVVPDTYAWIPFGGGIRRCIGASFAHMEMDVVLRVLLERCEVLPSSEPDEAWAFRGVVWAPADGGRIAVRRRTSGPAQAVPVAA